MKAHVRFRRFGNLQPWLPWAACSATLLFGTAFGLEGDGAGCAKFLRDVERGTERAR